MFVLNPDPFLQPAYRISPFRTSDIAFNHSLPENDRIEDYFKERFRGRWYQYTYNGREAINIALKHYNLKKDDIVTIYTTTGNFYISSCVTKEIEKFCKWSRKLEKNTRVILVNHEFGFPYKNLIELKDLGIPVIEDCAHSFFSNNPDNSVGKVGDFVIYSFPKMFPLQIGGLLVSNLQESLYKKDQVSKEELRHIKNVLSWYIGTKDEIIQTRISNYNFLKERFEALGFRARFQLDQGVIPGVFMFSTEGHNLNLPELKKYFYSHGSQCSVFYGEEAFFIPVHQSLTEQDMEYFYEVMKSFLK